MARRLQLRRGIASQHSAFIGAIGEVTVDTDKDTLIVHDGVTQGDKALATEKYVQQMLADGGNDVYIGLIRIRVE